MNERYRYVSHYAEDPQLRESLNRFSRDMWGITVLRGGEQDYVPFSMLYDSEIVANVSVGRFDLVVGGQPVSASMIQTVMTREEHRHRGLIRELFAHVQQHVGETTGRTFLTASKSKERFYGQFGYRAHALTDHCLLPVQPSSGGGRSLRKIDYEAPAERGRLDDTLARRVPVSNQLGFVNRSWLFHWFCRYFYNDAIYFAAELDAYFLLAREHGSLVILDIVSERIPSLEEITTYLPLDGIRTIKTHFCADRLAGNYERIIDSEDFFFTDAAFPTPAGCVCLPETQRG